VVCFRTLFAVLLCFFLPPEPLPYQKIQASSARCFFGLFDYKTPFDISLLPPLFLELFFLSLLGRQPPFDAAWPLSPFEVVVRHIILFTLPVAPPPPPAARKASWGQVVKRRIAFVYKILATNPFLLVPGLIFS